MLARVTEHVLKQAQDSLTRANIMQIAAHLDGLRIPLLLPGITISTTPTNYGMINRFRVQQFRDGRWVPVGKIMSGE